MPRAKVSIRTLRKQLAAMTRERDAYKRAKGENDDRFMGERDQAREELRKALMEQDNLLAELEGHRMASAASAHVSVQRMFAEDDALRAAERERDEAKDETERVTRERDELLYDVKFLREREDHIARLLAVADGGQYRADWKAPIERIVSERDKASAKLIDALAVVREFVVSDTACAAGNDVDGETSRCVRWSRARGALVALADELTP